jgi:hypothetical protein
MTCFLEEWQIIVKKVLKALAKLEIRFSFLITSLAVLYLKSVCKRWQSLDVYPVDDGRSMDRYRWTFAHLSRLDVRREDIEEG